MPGTAHFLFQWQWKLTRLSVVGESVGPSPAQSSLTTSPRRQSRRTRRGGGFAINRKFPIPGLTCRRPHFLLFRSYFCEGEARFSIRMLWKLADNVKYEDDCEVSVEGSRATARGRSAFDQHRTTVRRSTLKASGLSFYYYYCYYEPIIC